MVMAARTGDGQAEEASAERIDAVVILIEFLRIAVVYRPESEES